jgi:hypothetical protein
MDLADLRSHINKPVVLRFRDGEEVAALLLGVDSVSQDLTYEVKDILRAGSPPARGTAVGATCVARLDELTSFAAKL